MEQKAGIWVINSRFWILWMC